MNLAAIILIQIAGITCAVAAGYTDGRMSERDKHRISRLDLQPGDTLVVKCEKRFTLEQAEHIRDAFRDKIEPPVEVIVIPAEFDLSVLSLAAA